MGIKLILLPVVLVVVFAPWIVLWAPFRLKPPVRFSIVLALLLVQAWAMGQTLEGSALIDLLDGLVNPLYFLFFPFLFLSLHPTTALAASILGFGEMVLSTAPGFAYRWRAHRLEQLPGERVSAAPFVVFQALILIGRVAAMLVVWFHALGGLGG